MDALLRQYLEQSGGRCPFPDTDPDVWISPDGQVGRVIVIAEADDDSTPDWVFVPLVTH